MKKNRNLYTTMYLDFFVILNDTDRAREREIERAIKYGEIKYGERAIKY